MSMVWLQVDATPGLRQGQAGVGIVVRRTTGTILAWHTARVAATTCNEAEYQGVICGLRFVVGRFGPCHVRCLTDSRLIVTHMVGQCQVRTPALYPLHAEVCALVARCGSVSFHHIPRTVNRLADALAWEAVGGVIALRRAAQEEP